MSLRARAFFFSIGPAFSVASAYAAPTLYEMAASEGRPPNVYRLLENYEPQLCEAVLTDLNKGFPMPRGFHLPEDHAMIQYHYYLGTNAGVGWTFQSSDFIRPPGEYADRITINSESYVIRRTYGSLSGVNNHSLQAFESPRVRIERIGEPVELNFYTERNGRIAEDDKRLFAFSIKNVIEIQGKHFVILKPMLEKWDNDTVYVVRPDTSGQYDLLCTMTLT